LKASYCPIPSNYQASVGNTYTRVTIQAFANKVYVDIRDYFAKDSVFYPTKRGVTLTKTEWQQLCDHAEQTGTALVRIHDELANNQQPALQTDFTITNELKQSIRLLNIADAFGTSQAVRVLITKTKANESQTNTKEISLKSLQWYNVVIHNRERINMLIDMLEKENSLAADKRKQDTLAAERSLFQATWSLPTLQEDQQQRHQ
jgi:hypothetical protein